MPSLTSILTCVTPLLLCVSCSMGVGGMLRAPDADMLKALEFIDSLRQRGAPPLSRRPEEPVSDPLHAEEDERSEELLQAVISTLQQTERTPRPGLLPASFLGGPNAGRGGHLEDASYPKMQLKTHGIKSHKKLPLMVEEEEGEGDDEEEEGEGGREGGAFKRTNENVEEKYTPQNLATLQSVFEELDKVTGGKTTKKWWDEEDEKDEEDDKKEMFNLRNVAYDDAGGEFADWGPLQEEEEEEEEEDKDELERSFDYMDEDEDEDDEDDGSDVVKRSKDPDDDTDLVDYYLLKVLEKTEEEEQKRAAEEEEAEEEEQWRTERRAAQYGDDMDPQTFYQLLLMSLKSQVPPEDLMDMLRTGQTSTLDKSHNYNLLSQSSSEKTRSRRPPDEHKNLKNLQTQRILQLLGFGGSRNRGDTPTRKEKQQRSSRRRPQPTRTGEDGEGELEEFVAAKMLQRYEPTHGDRKESRGGDGGGRTVHTYLDRSPSNQDRLSEDTHTHRRVNTLLQYLKAARDGGDAAA